MEQEQHILQVQRQAFPRGDRPLRSVLSWELRRLRANRLSWVVACLALLFFLSLIWLKHSWINRKGDLAIPILGSTSLGLVYEITLILMLMLGMFLPFVAAEAVARDYKQRMHELLMTTTLPSWAYVWGRYLARLLVGLGLAMIMFVAILAMNLALHLGEANYPAPQSSIVLAIWLVAVVPATVFLTSLSFFLGTLWPRLAIVLKLAILVGWVLLALVVRNWDTNGLADWNPTGRSIFIAVGEQFDRDYAASTQHVTSTVDKLRIAVQLQQQAPDLRPWIIPSLGLVGIGFVLTTIAALRFGRFREILH